MKQQIPRIRGAPGAPHHAPRISSIHPALLELLDPKTARYLAAVASEGKRDRYGLAYLDVSTGELRATEVDGIDALAGELCRAQPREVLIGEAEQGGEAERMAAVRATLATRYPGALYGSCVPLTWQQAGTLLESVLAGNLAELGLADRPLAARAAADVVGYARATQPAGNLPLSRLHVYEPGQILVLDETAVANLELTTTIMGGMAGMAGRKSGSLLAVIDETRTAPGGRLLRRWLLYPLTEIAPIRRRQDAIEYFVHNAALRAEVRDQLEHVHDLERLSARVGLGVATPRDLGRLRDSLARLPELARLVAGSNAPELPDQPDLVDLVIPDLLGFDPAMLGELAGVRQKLEDALAGPSVA